MVDLWFFISSYSVIQSCGGSLVFISSYSEIPVREGSLFIMVPLDQLQRDPWLGRISGFLSVLTVRSKAVVDLCFLSVLTVRSKAVVDLCFFLSVLTV